MFSRIGLVTVSVLLAPAVLATEGAVATGHPLATQAGITMLKRGGNAMDAAVAASFVLGVVEPEGSGLGGGGFAVVYDAKRQQSRTLDFREVAPRRVRPDTYVENSEPQTQRTKEGVLAGAVPGQVRGLVLLHRTYGRLNFKQVVAPAIRLAEQGFSVSAELQQHLERSQTRLSRQSASAKIWYVEGRVPMAGTILKQSDLAKTLKAIAASGGESFYTGSTSRLWVQYMKQAQGLTTAQDLKEYRPVWRDPLVGLYRDYTVVSMPPPSSGGVHLIQMLNVLGLRDLKGMATDQRTLFMAETMKLAYADRSRFLGDPAFVPVPVPQLTALNYARRLEATISLQPVPSKMIEPGALLDSATRARFKTWEVAAESQNTSHLSAMDGQGNAIALTQTINGSFGAGVVVPGTGVLLNNEMDDFAIAPGVPNLFGLVGGAANRIEPFKRPLSSMTPTLIFKAGRPWVALGSPGGAFIITSVLQTMVNLIDLEQPLDQAIRSPRFHHQWLPDQLFVEADLSQPLKEQLQTQGYTLRSLRAMGSVQAVMAEPLAPFKFQAAADPRREGTGQVYIKAK